MKHARSDYEAIQPWPTKRPHFAKQNGNTVEVPVDDPDWKGIDARAQVSAGLVQPIIPDDEPVFILRAKDITAPEVVRYWCDVQEREGGDPVVAACIRRFSVEMEAYGQEHGAKMPDTPHELLQP